MKRMLLKWLLKNLEDFKSGVENNSPPAQRSLYSLLSLSKELRDKSVNLLYQTMQSVDPKDPSIDCIVVHNVILFRMVHLQQVVENILQENNYSEAGILVLTQFELKLDVQYIGDDSSLAQQWQRHDKLTEHPWPVKKKLRKVHGNNIESETLEKQYFALLSALKHGNPVLMGFAIPEVLGKNLSKDESNELVAAYSLAVCALSVYFLSTALNVLKQCLRDRIDNDTKKDISEMHVKALTYARDAFKEAVRNIKMEETR